MYSWCSCFSFFLCYLKKKNYKNLKLNTRTPRKRNKIKVKSHSVHIVMRCRLSVCDQIVCVGGYKVFFFFLHGGYKVKLSYIIQSSDGMYLALIHKFAWKRSNACLVIYVLQWFPLQTRVFLAILIANSGLPKKFDFLVFLVYSIFKHSVFPFWAVKKKHQKEFSFFWKGKWKSEWMSSGNIIIMLNSKSILEKSLNYRIWL